MGQCEAMVDNEQDSTCHHLQGYVITKNYKPAAKIGSHPWGEPRYRRFVSACIEGAHRHV